MKQQELLEKIALTIFQFEGGLTPDEYEEVTGIKKGIWRINYDFQDKSLELAQHERDEYYAQAAAVLDRLIQLGAIELKTNGNTSI